MSDWVIYSSNFDIAVTHLNEVNPNRVDEEGTIKVKMGPVGLIRDDKRAMALVACDEPEDGVELNQVVAKGNLKILGAFDPDTGEFLPAFNGARDIFDEMRPRQRTITWLDGSTKDIEFPEQFTSLT